jgi:hypothetical protein
MAETFILWDATVGPVIKTRTHIPSVIWYYLYPREIEAYPINVKRVGSPSFWAFLLSARYANNSLGKSLHS